MKRYILILSLLAVTNLTRAQYTGGNSDGSSTSSVNNQNPLPDIYRGGNDDGFSHASVSGPNPLPNIYRGGNDDGFSHAEVTNQNPQLFAITSTRSRLLPLSPEFIIVNKKKLLS